MGCVNGRISDREEKKGRERCNGRLALPKIDEIEENKWMKGMDEREWVNG